MKPLDWILTAVLAGALTFAAVERARPTNSKSADEGPSPQIEWPE